MRLPSLNFLIGFEAAARLGNYARAAEELYISPSAISHQMAQLEQHVGQPLFKRQGRGVTLTVAGRLLLERVAGPLAQIRGGLGQLDVYLDANLLTIVCPAPLAHGWLQGQLAALVAAHPGLCPLIATDETARYVDELDVDIAISRAPLRQRGVRDEPLLTDADLVVAAPALAARLPADPASHARHAGLLCLEAALTDPQRGPYLRTHLGHLTRLGIYDDARLLLDAVLRGWGLALLPRALAAGDLAQGRLVAVAGYPELPGETYWISCREGEGRTPVIGAVFGALRGAAAG
ncbi:MAG: LysR family transcriptional regulator [Proteobacteria bacterium]|nr:LysR family transcriptional regulator [Pseudomonadota bacterium]